MEFAGGVVERGYVFHTLSYDNRAFLCKPEIPHVEHIVDIGVELVFFEKIVLLFESFVVALKRKEIRFLLLRKTYVEESSSFVGGFLDEFHLVGGEKHHSEHAQKFACAIDGDSVHGNFLFALLVYLQTNGVFAEFLFDIELDLRFALPEQNHFLILGGARGVENRAKKHAFEHIRFSAGVFSVQNVEPVIELDEGVRIISEVFKFQRKNFHTLQV